MNAIVISHVKFNFFQFSFVLALFLKPNLSCDEFLVSPQIADL